MLLLLRHKRLKSKKAGRRRLGCTHHKIILIPLPTSTYGRVPEFLTDPVGLVLMATDQRTTNGNVIVGVNLLWCNRVNTAWSENPLRSLRSRTFFLFQFFVIYKHFDLCSSLYLIQVCWCCFLCFIWYQNKWTCEWTIRSVCVPNSLPAISSLIKANF